MGLYLWIGYGIQYMLKSTCNFFRGSFSWFTRRIYIVCCISSAGSCIVALFELCAQFIFPTSSTHTSKHLLPHLPITFELKTIDASWHECTCEGVSVSRGSVMQSWYGVRMIVRARSLCPGLTEGHTKTCGSTCVLFPGPYFEVSAYFGGLRSSDPGCMCRGPLCGASLHGSSNNRRFL